VRKAVKALVAASAAIIAASVMTGCSSSDEQATEPKSLKRVLTHLQISFYLKMPVHSAQLLEKIFLSNFRLM
jgi:hypothetical protein